MLLWQERCLISVKAARKHVHHRIETSCPRCGSMPITWTWLCHKPYTRAGYQVSVWSRSGGSHTTSKQALNVFSGRSELHALLPKTNVVVCLLPLTQQTENLIDKDLLSRMPEGASVINAARGAHVVDADMLQALDSGVQSSFEKQLQACHVNEQQHSAPGQA